MAIPRVIPVLLLKNKGLVKSVKFKDYRYVGDPINAVRIFNEKEVDELMFLDIEASKTGHAPRLDVLQQIASECFMPLGYGGGVSTIDHIKSLIQCGIEKISINSAALDKLDFIKSACDQFGSSTIVGAIDVKKNLWGKYHVFNHKSNKILERDPLAFAESLQKAGVGELFINIVDRDGIMEGFDFEFIKKITAAIDVPVIACGGCGSIKDIDQVINYSNASAAAAGSFFVFHGKHKAVLITYPEYGVLENMFSHKGND